MHLLLNYKLGHRFSQISTDIWLFVAIIILVIRVHPCPEMEIPILSNLGLRPIGMMEYWNHGFWGNGMLGLEN